MLRKFGIIAVVSLMALAIAAVPALAATIVDPTNAPNGAHYRQGFGDPACSFTSATSVTCTGTQIAGVGNANAIGTLVLNTSADVVCRNPGSKDKIVEPHNYTDTDTTTSPLLRPDRNGTLVVPSLTGSTSAAEFDANFECPNTNWQDEVTNVQVTGFTYTLQFVGYPGPYITVTG